MAKLPHTSETAIAITFLVMNLSALLRQVLSLFSVNFKKQLLILSKRLMKLMFLSTFDNQNLSDKRA